VHVHCKDVRPQVIAQARNEGWSFLTGVLNGIFTVPGDGVIDYTSVLSTLHGAGYQGWLVVEAEQDPAVAPSYRYARMGYQCLRSIVERLDRPAVS
jgi:inosose dehydratase